MLEDRVLYLEQRNGPGSSAVAANGGGRRRVTGTHTLPDGRELPVVKLAPHARPRPAARTPEPAAEIEDDEGYVPASVPSSQSYSLVGTRLVDLTREKAPAGPDRPDRGVKGQAIIGEYEAAMLVYQSGHVERAESAFDDFAHDYPKHDYADNALYWKGEAAYDQRHYSDALAAFTEVVERYGGGNKAPDALLKIGLCYRQLGDLPNARDVLGELIGAYPGERASDIARVKLAELES